MSSHGVRAFSSPKARLHCYASGTRYIRYLVAPFRLALIRGWDQVESVNLKAGAQGSTAERLMTLWTVRVT